MSLLFLPKGLKCETFAVVGINIVGVQVDGLLIGEQRFLIALEVMEGTPFVVIGMSIAGVQVDGLLKSGECFLVPLEVTEAMPLL